MILSVIFINFIDIYGMNLEFLGKIPMGIHK